MSHAGQAFLNLPKKLVIQPRLGTALNQLERIQLIIKGQATVSFVLDKQPSFTFTLTATAPKHTDPKHTGRGLRVEITNDGATIYERNDVEWLPVKKSKEEGIGIDDKHACKYWISLDGHNRKVRYGKGEMRRKTVLFEFDFPPDADEKGGDPYAWFSKVESVELSPQIDKEIEIWRDPVVNEPPLFVLAVDKITMADVALNRVTVPANLTPACQLLYGNVAGSNFQLNTDDFPEFVDAIEASIQDPQGWCYRKLAEKAGKHNGPKIKETYLRITLGLNQGDSPGIPYVMEIWPPGHYSPIHNHAGANAVIRVLHGEISVKLFPMLSELPQTPFAEQVFRKDDVTWIAPGLNQIHQLTNRNECGPTCITIQCYMYGDKDTAHYEYFDYISKDGKIGQFTPNSDMDFLTFKEEMRNEWQSRHAHVR